MIADRDRVTAVIPAWRAAGTVGCSLRSLLVDNSECLDRVIVVASGVDDTAAVAASFAGVEVISSPARLSAGQARNLGRRRAGEARRLLFLDADCRLAPGALAMMGEVMDRGSYHAVGAGVVACGGGVVGRLRHILEFKESTPTRQPAGSHLARSFVPSTALLCRTAAFDRAGGFPDMWPGEDLIFCHRMVADGSRLGFAGAALAYHHHPQGWAAMLRHQFRLGNTSARARLSTGMKGVAFVRHRLLVPLLVVGRALRALQWFVFLRPRELAGFILLSPFYMVALVVWGAGFVWKRES